MMSPITSPSPVTSDTQASSSATPATSNYSGRKRAKKVVPQSSSVASVLETYLSKKEEVKPSSAQEDTLTDFFLNMSKTVKTFPKRDQLLIKNELFQIVNKVELRLLDETTTESKISSFQEQQDYVSPPSYELPSTDMEETGSDQLLNTFLRFRS